MKRTSIWCTHKRSAELRFGAIIGLLCANMRAGAADEIPKLQPPRGDLGPSFWEQNHWPIVIAVLFGLVVAAVLIALFRRPVVIVPTSPEAEARIALGRLRNRAEDGALLVEVSRIVRRYVIAVFALPPDELTTAEVGRALQARAQGPPDLAPAIGDFLRHCDEWKFAPTPPSPTSGAVAGALALIEKIEASRPPVRKPDAPATGQPTASQTPA